MSTIVMRNVDEVGFLASTLLFVLVLLALVAGIGTIAIKRERQSRDLNVPASVSQSSSSPGQLAIPQLGISLIAIPSNLRDLTYAVTYDNSSGVGVEFSTATLTRQDPSHCAAGDGAGLGGLSRIAGTYDSQNDDGMDNTLFVKQLDGFWIAYSSGEAACSQEPAIQSLQRSQSNSFAAFAREATNISVDNN